MYVHFKRNNEQNNWEYIGLGHDYSEDPDAVNCPLTEEEYIEWIQNPALFRKYEPVQDGDIWIVEEIIERRKLEDMELVPYTEDSAEDQSCDVLLVLTHGTALVHMFNTRMSSDERVKVQYYATEADDHSSPIFDLEAVGTDTVLQDLEYDPKNIRVIVREPMDGIVYGLKITS